MVDYEENFLKFSQNFLPDARIKQIFLIDNHYKTIFVSLTMSYSSPTVVCEHTIIMT